jgi:replicative DNA helicase
MQKLIDAEKAILCQIIRNPDIYYELDLVPENFIDNRNKMIFKAINSCLVEGIKPELNTIYDKAKNIPAVYIASITDQIPSAANWKYYHDRVIENSRKYYLKKLPVQIDDWHKQCTSDEIIKRITDEIERITRQKQQRKIKTPATILPDWIMKLEQKVKDGGNLPGLSTGIRDLDNILLGFEKRKLYYIGARPGEGKSALSLNIAAHLALRENKKVGFLSLESGNEELINRLVSSEGRINSKNIRTGYQIDFKKVMTICDELNTAELYIDDTPDMDLNKLIMQTKKMITLYGIDIFFIDYLQLIKHGNNNQPMRDRMKEVSLNLKILARNYNIPIVCLSQLRRDAENRRPRMSDFSETSQIEKDGDGIIVIYHGKTNSELIVIKNRDGKTDTVDVNFVKDYVRFYEVGNG